MSQTNSYLNRNYKMGDNNTKAVRIIITFTAFLLIFFICFIVSFRFALVSDTKKSRPIPEIKAKDRIEVRIPMGSSTEDIAEILHEKGVIKHPLIFRILSNLDGYDGAYKSGTHILSSKLEYYDIMRILASNPDGIKITIPEGYNLKQIEEKLLEEKLIDSDKFYDEINNGKFDFSFISGIPERENRLEGYLFPDTYEFDLSAGEREIIRRMLENFDNKFTPKYYQQAQNLGLTVDQVIILASIVEKEAKISSERARIAGVFLNRLSGNYSTGRKLESCATIQYIYYKKYGTVKNEITDEDTRIDDPYNTYLYEGLPPGPICNPGLESIEAVLYPESHQYLYFVAKGDGTHYFSTTKAEHEAAKAMYAANQ